MEIVKNQGNVWNIDCLSKLKAVCKLTNTDVVSLQPFILLAIKETSPIDWGL